MHFEGLMCYFFICKDVLKRPFQKKNFWGARMSIYLGPEYPVHAAMSAELLTEGPAQALA
jgi:hypothetical protein